MTRGQLLALGSAPSWIRSQLDQELLIQVHAGVYALGHVPRGARPQAMAAVLACGPGTVLSHASAAALWDAAEWPAFPEVSTPGNRTRTGVRVHRSRTLIPPEVRRHHGLPTTSPGRTILDLQPRLDDTRLVRAVNDLRVAGHLGPTPFAELCSRSRRIAGLLGDAEARPTRSALEDLFRRFAARHDLPLPEINARLPESGREVDALYRRERLIIELDSWTFHSSRASFERDRALDARALAGGYRTVRVTARRLRHDGDVEAHTIRRILADADADADADPDTDPDPDPE